ncbi:uncharacterized protein LOC127530090 isoform X2 [Erpetoichthys calabaricus]|uniref:Uncharacterized protein n=1 Tax=Erpetoichthys calabaricus TaxID=27687 RepID=A0A8C4SXZ7_ERPCA|nr:uncharacterized protein LOC127530090 isoform X2 [Erpetoichthys calabaricus]
MISVHPAVAVVCLLFLITTEASISSGRGGGSFDYDIRTKSELTELYNSKVFMAERMERPKGSWKWKLTGTAGPVSHTGVRVTLSDGSQWLIHKGSGYGKSSETVVVDAKHMSHEWKVIETKDFEGTRTVSDFVKAGGSYYNLLIDNCHDASRRMMDQK